MPHTGPNCGKKSRVVLCIISEADSFHFQPPQVGHSFGMNISVNLYLSDSETAFS